MKEWGLDCDLGCCHAIRVEIAADGSKRREVDQGKCQRLGLRDRLDQLPGLTLVDAD